MKSIHSWFLNLLFYWEWENLDLKEEGQDGPGYIYIYINLLDNLSLYKIIKQRLQDKDEAKVHSQHR